MAAVDRFRGQANVRFGVLQIGLAPALAEAGCVVLEESRRRAAVARGLGVAPGLVAQDPQRLVYVAGLEVLRDEFPPALDLGSRHR